MTVTIRQTERAAILLTRLGTTHKLATRWGAVPQEGRPHLLVALASLWHEVLLDLGLDPTSSAQALLDSNTAKVTAQDGAWEPPDRGAFIAAVLCSRIAALDEAHALGTARSVCDGSDRALELYTLAHLTAVIRASITAKRAPVDDYLLMFAASHAAHDRHANPN